MLAAAQNHRLVRGSQPPNFGYLWQAQLGKQVARAPEERVKVKATRDVAFSNGGQTETGVRVAWFGEGVDHGLWLPGLPDTALQRLETI